MKVLACVLAFTLASAAASSAYAQEPAPAYPPSAPEPGAPAKSAAPKPKPKKPFRYSIPWQLRPAAAPNIVRSDTSMAFYKDPRTKESGATVASMLTGAIHLGDDFGVSARIGLVHNTPPNPPTTAGDAFALTNPAVGGTYVLHPTEAIRIALFLGATIPVGMGGGSSPDAATSLAIRSGILARSAMDNALFSVNHFAVFPGVGVAWVAHGFTVQAEATFFQLVKTRGPANVDEAITNFTSGFHAGYFVLPRLSVGAELRYQRFLKNDSLTNTPAIDNLTVSGGVRGHFSLGGTHWLRPGVSYTHGLEDPTWNAGYHIGQVDIVWMM